VISSSPHLSRELRRVNHTLPLSQLRLLAHNLLKRIGDRGWGNHVEVLECLGLVRLLEGALLVVSLESPSPHHGHFSKFPSRSTQARHAHMPAYNLKRNAHQIRASRISAKRAQIKATEAQEQKKGNRKLHSKSDEYKCQRHQRSPNREEVAWVAKWMLWPALSFVWPPLSVGMTFGSLSAVEGSSPSKHLVSKFCFCSSRGTAHSCDEPEDPILRASLSSQEVN